MEFLWRRKFYMEDCFYVIFVVVRLSLFVCEKWNRVFSVPIVNIMPDRRETENDLQMQVKINIPAIKCK